MLPEVSVITVVGAQRSRAQRCIELILAQAEPYRIEIITVDVADGGPFSDDPRVRYLAAGDVGNIAEAKVRGVSVARGDFFLFIEDHCHPRSNWLCGVMNGFAQGADVVGYSFYNMNPVNYTSRAFLVFAYGPWLGPAESGPVEMPSWMNVAYRRSALEKFSDRYLEVLHREAHIFEELKARGSTLWLAGDAEVEHMNHPTLRGACWDTSVWQRLVAAARVREGNWSVGRKLVYTLGAPLIPLVTTYRLLQRVSHRAEIVPLFWTALPLVLVIFTVGTFWEVCGYWLGEGNSGRESLLVETADPRTL